MCKGAANTQPHQRAQVSHLAVVLHGQIQPLGLQLAAVRAGVLEQLAAVVKMHLNVRWQLATLRCAAGAGLLRTQAMNVVVSSVP